MRNAFIGMVDCKAGSSVRVALEAGSLAEALAMVEMMQPGYRCVLWEALPAAEGERARCLGPGRAWW